MGEKISVFDIDKKYCQKATCINCDTDMEHVKSSLNEREFICKKCGYVEWVRF